MRPETPARYSRRSPQESLPLYESALGRQARGRLRAVDDHLGGIVRVEDVAARVRDELEAVHHAAFVVGALEDISKLDALVLLDLRGHLDELVVGRRRL